MTLLRAMDPKYSQDAELLRVFYDTTTEKVVDGRSVGKIEGKIAVDDIVYPASSEQGRRDHRRSRAEDHQERGRGDLHVGPDDRSK